MCLAIPGKVLSLQEGERDLLMGEVSFGGTRRQVCLSCTPEARVGDYVLVHAGFAISRVDEAQAERIFEVLESLGPAGGPDAT